MQPTSVLVALTLLAGTSTAAPARDPAGRVERVEHVRTDGAPALGPSAAPVTIELFGNLGDGYATGALHGLVRELARRHPARVRVIYRLIAGGPAANEHILVALEAHAQGRFFELVDRLYAATRRSPRAADLPDLAAAAGLDRARVAQALDVAHGSELLRERIAGVRANNYRRRRFQVRRVPGLLVNGVAYDRRVSSIEELEEIYDQAYGVAMARLDDGVALEELYPRLLDERGRALPEPPSGPGAIDGFELEEPNERDPGRTVHLDRRRGELLGRPDAPVRLTFFCNLQTRPCAQAALALDELRAAYPDEVSVVFRDLVDPADEAQADATRYAVAARCAGRSGRFEDVYDLLLRRSSSTPLGLAGLVELAAERGLDRRRFRACMADPAGPRAIARERAAARREGVRRTPALVLGGRLYLGARSYDELAWRVDRLLDPGVLEDLATP
jgi:protein-disulfide isomerase